MGKRKLMVGVVLGAILGGIVALFDREARQYSKHQLTVLKDKTTNSVKHPSETVHNLKVSFDKLNKSFTNNAENAINALEQVEQTLDKFTNNDQAKLDDTM
ncbi:YtxH domain-containing protein [Oceanobacillus halotolerans]|uniref:YtxH domain-containing protein n=1 Tax=Oceanobacillus halotolerans TaxID=2663380 RepID=UPI0013DA43ED|nr:YtxH domain-containing protein [Oceanobacillus halotolerans]